MIHRPSDRIAEVKTYYFATKLAEIAEMNALGHQVLNIGIGSPDMNPPEVVLDTLTNAAYEDGSSMYQSYRGLPGLREAFAQHYQRFLNTTLDPKNEILPLIGSKEGIMHISMSLLNPGDQVLVPNPGYPSYSATARITGAQPVHYDLEEGLGWKPDLSAIAKLDLTKVKMMWINYPNMPTGATLSDNDMEELVQFAQKNDIILCHDNPYNFILNSEPKSFLSVAGAKDCTLELYSLSKCFNMAGWRVGALAGRKEYIDTVLRFKSNMDSGMYKPIQLAAITALQLGTEWFDQLNKIYSKRREEVFRIFDLLDCTYDRDAAGLFVWAKVPSYINDVKEWVDEILQASKVFITPGFIFGSNGNRYVRIALCSPSETFKEVQTRLAHTFIKSIA